MTYILTFIWHSSLKRLKLRPWNARQYDQTNNRGSSNQNLFSDIFWNYVCHLIWHIFWHSTSDILSDIQLTFYRASYSGLPPQSWRARCCTEADVSVIVWSRGVRVGCFLKIWRASAGRWGKTCTCSEEKYKFGGKNSHNKTSLMQHPKQQSDIANWAPEITIRHRKSSNRTRGILVYASTQGSHSTWHRLRRGCCRKEMRKHIAGAHVRRLLAGQLSHHRLPSPPSGISAWAAWRT